MSHIRGLHGGSSSDFVYFEVQAAQGRLCGLHCLNNLLQGPHYRVEDVSAIGMHLDAEERRLTQGQVDSTYSNVSHDGFFSVSVIEQCLVQRGFVMIPFGNPKVADMRSEPARHNDAFICNFREHWFAVRCVKGRYFKLDSLRPAPEPVSHSTLRDFLDSLRGNSYSVFVIRSGEWPKVKVPEPCPQDFNRNVITQAAQPVQGGAYLTFDAAARLLESYDSNSQQTGLRDDATQGPGPNAKPVKETKVVHEWPTSPGQTVGGGSAASLSNAVNTDVDPETLQILLVSAAEFKQSLPSPPLEDGTGVWLQVIDVHGTQHRRRFPHQSTLQHLFHWIHKDDKIMASAIPALATRFELTLTANFPKRLYTRRYVNGALTVTRNGSVDVTETLLAAEFPQGESLRLSVSE